MNKDISNIDALRRVNCKQNGIRFTKKMNIIYARSNLEKCIKVLHEVELRYVIYFGTLLGIIRDNDFIKYDTDTDVALFDINEHQLGEFKKIIKRYGFNIFRDDEDLLSIIKNGEYIDLYKFKRKGDEYYCGKHQVKAELFNNRISIKFNKINLYVPYSPKDCLEFLYGLEWETPIRRFHAPGTKNLQKMPIRRKWIRTKNFFWLVFSTLGIESKVVFLYKKFIVRRR